MRKKKIGTSIVSKLLLSGFVLSGCANMNLVEYKAEGKRLIDTHATTKIQSEYSTGNWSVLLSEVIDGEKAVERAKSKPIVAKTAGNAITAINNVKTKLAEEMAGIIELFDFTDPKETWDGSLMMFNSMD